MKPAAGAACAAQIGMKPATTRAPPGTLQVPALADATLLFRLL